MPTIVGFLTFMSRINFVLILVEHGKSFITSGQIWVQTVCKGNQQMTKVAASKEGVKIVFLLCCVDYVKLLINCYPTSYLS